MRLLTVIQLNGDCEIFGETRIFKIQPVSALLSFSEIFQKPYHIISKVHQPIFLQQKVVKYQNFRNFFKKEF